MATLVKKENEIFEEVYEGSLKRINKKTYKSEEVKVKCYLDDNCVRYVVIINGKLKTKKEFRNDQKELCFKKATIALNK